MTNEEDMPAVTEVTAVPTESARDPSPVEPSPPARPSWESLAVLLLVLILLLGAYFRFTGLNWDENYHLHPDERFLTIVSSALQTTADPLTYLRTSESPLNPYNVGQTFYVYGNFPLTMTRYLAEWGNSACALLGAAGPEWCANDLTAYDGIHVFGRFLSGLMDLISIFFIFLIGRRLYDWRTGLLGALLLALAVMPIQQSHFFTMDNWAAALTTMTLYAAVRAATLGDAGTAWQARWYVLFGLGLGLAAASRINIAPLALMIGVAAAIWLLRHNAITVPDWHNLRALPGADLNRVIFGVALAAVVSLLTFRLAQPYAFSDGALARQQVLEATGTEPGALGTAVRSVFGFNHLWLANMEEIQRLQAPEASFPPALQWTDRTPLLFPFTNIVLYGMGLTAGLAAWLGLLWALWRMVRFRADWMNHAIPVIWSLFYFLFMGTRWVKSVRYFLPIYPTLLLLGAWALIMLWDMARRSESRRGAKTAAAAGLLAVVIVPTFLWATSFVSIYQRPVTRIAASEWIFDNVPSGATVLYEVDGEMRQEQLPLKEYTFEPGGMPLLLNIRLPEAGTITGVRFNYLSDAADDPNGRNGAKLQLTLNGQDAGQFTLDVQDEPRAVLLDLPDTAVAGGETVVLGAELRDGDAIQVRTSILANEHWDDLLPVGLDGRNAYGSFYTEVAGGQRPVTHPDNPQKLEEVLAWLDEADYIMLSSQRALWHLARLPLTYPLMMRYYEALFSGELGFDLAHQEHADLRIGPLYLSDTTGQIGWGQPPAAGWPPPGALAAEEAFSVYDHPPVWIFEKSDAYDPARVRAILGSVDLSQVTVMNPLQATQAPNGLLLSAEALAQQQANGSFSAVFDVDGLSQRPFLAAVAWWLAIVVLGWLAFPLTFVTLHGLPDRGYALARILGLLFVSYFAWLMASLQWLPHARETLLLGVLLLAAISVLIFWRRRDEMAAYVRAHWRFLLFLEAIAVLLFILQIGIRLGNPDVWDVIWGGEKPMDLTYFTAVMKSTTFPPYDPWFAGGYINYYYYGFVLAGVLAKLLGIVPTVAYNLVLPMLYSFAGLGVFSIAYNLVRYRQLSRTPAAAATDQRQATWAGFLAMVLAVIVGNLAQVGVLVDAWYRTGTESLSTLPLIGAVARTADGAIKVLSGQPAAVYPGDWFWNATRALNYLEGEAAPITEFPFFTFLYGDLHAHMISIPLQLLALGWAVALALQTPRGASPEPRPLSWWETGLQWLVGGLAIGSLRATNTWDWPTYLVIGSLAVIFMSYRQVGRLDLHTAGQSLVLIGLLFGLSTALFWPFSANYGVGYTSLALWPGSYTEVGSYLKVYGVFLFSVITFLLLEFRDWARTWTQEGLRRLEPAAGLLLAALILYPILLLLLVIRGYWVAPLVLTLILAAGLLGLRPGLDAARRVVLILIACALGLSLLVEIVVLEGDIGRMNTVFKFYMQAWLLLSVTSGATAVWSWERIRQKGSMRTAWQVALALLLAAAALYPILATQAKWDIRMSQEAPNTLDGMAFMPYVEYGDTDFAGNSVTIPLASEYAALRWMQRNIPGSPVVAEAHGGNPYRSIVNRVSMYTGLPAVIGWDWHQRQQRAVLSGEFVSQRISDVNTLFSTADPDLALDILDRYGVGYIFVGELERAYYPPEGLAKFDEMAAQGLLSRVYADGGITVYKVEGRQATG